MKLKDYKRCPNCNRINKTGKMCEKCKKLLQEEQEKENAEELIKANFKYKKPDYNEGGILGFW